VVLPVLILIAFGVVAYQMIRRPDLRRLAVRDTVRRRGETILVIVGSLLGTAIMTGSFIVGDTLDASIRATATDQLGPVDELIVVPDPAQASQIRDKISGLDDPNIDGVTSVFRVPAAISIGAQGTPRAEPSARLVELDFDEGEAFGGDRAATALSGETPGPGKVAVNQDLADDLKLTTGDVVTASLFGKQLELEVDRILPARGLAGFWTDLGSKSPNAFVAPGTLAELTGDGVPAGAVPPVTTIIVSNTGGIEEGAPLSGSVKSAIEDVLDDPSIRVEPVKDDALDLAKTQGDQFSQLFFSIGSFAVIAGILLLVQIFVMLSEERKGQLGMLRAVGMRRSDLVRSFYMQGGLYALPAGVLGALLGIGVGWAIIKVAAPIFGGSGDFSLALTFALEPISLVSGFCIGALISLVTVFLTSVRISRINIIRAIRDLPEPPRLKAKLRTLIFGVLISFIGASVFAGGMSNGDAWPGVLLGPPLVLFGLLPTMSRFLPRRPAVIFVAAASLAWGVLADTITGGKAFGGGDITAFVLQGVLLNISAVVLLSQVQENLGGLLRKFAARSLPLRLGLSYPLARRFRTGLTLGMFSLVIFTMVFISVLSNVFGGQIENTLRKEAGGYDLLVDSLPSNPPSPDQLRIEGVDQVAATLYGSAQFKLEDGTEDPWAVTGIDETFMSATPPDLEEIAPGIADDAEAWNQIATDPTVTAVPAFFLQTGGGPAAGLVKVGDEITMTDPVTGKSSTRKIIAFTGSQDFQTLSAFMAADGVRDVLGDQVAPSRFYIDAAGTAADAQDLGERLQGQFIANGVEADTFRSFVEESQAGSTQFLRLMQGYLALGLLVGIAGIGVVMVRAVRERRREVGVLRSLGFRPGMIRRAFILESAFTAFEGILVGTVLALITAYQLIANGEFGEGVVFQVPWLDVSILLLVSIGASLAATWWPAHEASQIPPAVALRIAD
jgi:putative ABC transport system permease protein